MDCKKLKICSFLGGLALGIGITMMNNTLDYKINYLKRKLNCLNRKINRALNKMSEENLNKYKDEILTSYENIKTKIDNITIKDIKDAGNELVDTILDHIRELKNKINTYLK